jgi:carboxyl-terminal processing protease
MACGEPSSTSHAGASTTSSAPQAALREPEPQAPPASAPRDDDADEAPQEKFADGARTFAKVRETLLQNYYAEGITEDDLYRAATAGMLEKLEPRMKKWNKLMTAHEVAELKNDLKGEVVGIGVHIKFDPQSGYADVLATFPGSPSEKAGLLAGDKIVTVNGKLYKGMRMRDVVADIRGKAGETVTLSVLRADKLLSFTVARERVGYDLPLHDLHPDGLGYLRIPSFNDKTPARVREALEDLQKRGARALVVDVRQSPGGSFERAVETADLLLPGGAGIVTLKRKGRPEEKHVAKGKGILVDVPLAVLVDGGTASGAEFVAAALSEGRHARLVGARTTGKWSVQTIDELANGFAIKYTVSIFKTPSGKSYEATGIVPEVEVAMDDKQLARANAAATPEQRLAIDVQLRTAKELLLVRRP